MTGEGFRYSDDMDHENLISYHYSDLHGRSSQNRQEYEGARVYGVGEIFDHESPKEKREIMAYLVLRNGEGVSMPLKDLKANSIDDLLENPTALA